MSKLVAVLLLLAVFGAGMQCVADCLTPHSVPPCHQHSQKKEPCSHGQLVAITQALADQPVAMVTQLMPAADPAEVSVTLPMRLLTILRI